MSPTRSAARSGLIGLVLVAGSVGCGKRLDKDVPMPALALELGFLGEGAGEYAEIHQTLERGFAGRAPDLLLLQGGEGFDATQALPLLRDGGEALHGPADGGVPVSSSPAGAPVSAKVTRGVRSCVTRRVT